MTTPHRNLTPSQAAAHLGVSIKALRLYEQQGLIAPERSAGGWRLYNGADLDRAGQIVSLRALGLSLAQVARALAGEASALDAGLAAHEERLARQARQVAAALKRVRSLRADLHPGQAPATAELERALAQEGRISVAFALPWPWGGEWFSLRDIAPLTFITGPLGSGKTRFAQRLAAELPDAAFLGLNRLAEDDIRDRLNSDTAWAARVDRALAWLEGDGAVPSAALLTLVAALEAETPANLVIDLVEEGLCEATQRALAAYLRLTAHPGRTLFLMTRSSAMLDLDQIGPDETILYCPANHSPPFRAATTPGGHGHEAVATCLATPEIRARTAGIVAMRPTGG